MPLDGPRPEPGVDGSTGRSEGTLAPDDPRLADAAGVERAVYLHTPFCARVCPYCDFAVVEGRTDGASRYVDAVIAELSRAADMDPVAAVYLGGGTPSLLPAVDLARLVSAVVDRFGLTPGAEVSMEANPEDVTAARAAEFVEAGFTRISFGAQSFDPVVLAYLGRRHDPGGIDGAVYAARSAGFRSVNLDLIFGSPPETRQSWAATVSSVLALPVDHVSAYALTVERGTPLARAVAGGASAPDPDTQADAYDHLATAASAAGLVRYEVSNWAKHGHTCTYNLVAWAHGEYAAAGLGAHRHRAGVRSWNVRNLDTYLRRAEAAESVWLGEERLEGDDRERERLMVGVRRAAGVVAGPVGSRWLATEEAGRMRQHGIVEVDGDDAAARIRVARPLFTDAVARSLLTTTA